jgi:lipopolysaccharide export system protein LptA
VQGLREATCGRAEVLPRDDRITLTENPAVTDHGNGTVCTGDKLVLLKGQRRVLGDHVHITAPPIKDLGFDKNQPPPPATAPDPSP